MKTYFGSFGRFGYFAKSLISKLTYRIIKFNYLVDENGNYLVDENGNRLID